MLMKPDKKKSMASLIIGASAPSSMDELKSSNEELSEKPQMDQGLLSAAEELLTAFESKDVQGIVEALQSFMSMADDDDDSSEPSEPPQE